MKNICFYFQIHQPFRLKRYRFFDIGKDHYYYDDFSNEEIITRIAHNSYLPANQMLLDLIREYKGQFKVAFSFSGVALEQLEQYVPEFIDSMKELAKTGCVEFLSETYAHSLSALKDPEEFVEQVKAHDKKIELLFGKKPKVFRNTELIYDDDIALQLADMGIKGVITEGAKHILGWKSPNYVYNSVAAPKLKMLLKNSKLSDDISFRFSNYDWEDYPLTADKFMGWIKNSPEEEQIVNLFMNYETLGELQNKDTGIFEFFKAIPRFAQEMGIGFVTPNEAITKLKAVGELSVGHPISWADEARDISAWLGNTLQNEAFNKLYSVAERVRLCNDRRLKQDWYYLQASDHFYYMCTKYTNDGAMHSYFSPYNTPYEAFTNYMNVLSDFIVRVEAQYPLTIENEELNSLLTTIRNQASEIEELNRSLELMRKAAGMIEGNEEEEPKEEVKADAVEPKKTAKKAPATKTATKKTPVKK